MNIILLKETFLIVWNDEIQNASEIRKPLFTYINFDYTNKYLGPVDKTTYNGVKCNAYKIR